MESILNIVKVALGLGFVIFLHELGHFVLAKWNGVKVEKFSIGFGPTLLGFTKGETEYVIAAIPLGGFVKMLGEGPEEEANKSSDPRAYPNQSVGARMAIISAGVIMNLILGLFCFAYAYGQGLEVQPARIGSVMAGSPAYLAGIQAGDEMIEMDGRKDLTFLAMRIRVSLSGEGQKIHFQVKRAGQNDLVPIDVQARREPGLDAPTIGIYASQGLTLHKSPFRVPAGLTPDPAEPWKALKDSDEIKAVSLTADSDAELTPIEDAQSLFRFLAKHESEPVTIHVARKAASKAASGKDSTVAVTLPPNRFIDFGFRLTIEPVITIRPGSPADKAGFRVGDRIVKVDGREDFDPMTLPTLCFANAGKTMNFEVRRESSPQGALIPLTVTPDDAPPWTELPMPEEPLDVPGIGLAYHVRALIAAVKPGSPAEKAGLKPGNIINAMTLPAEPDDKKPPKPISFDDKTPNWPSAFQVLQRMLQPGESVSLKVDNSDKLVTVKPEPDPTWFIPTRGLQLQEYYVMTPPLSVVDSLKRGFDDTVDNILSIYLMVRSLVAGRVSMKALGGPVMISQVAYAAAGQGITDLVRFLGILSINLAVLNFMPIPPLDGGQMVFLIAEKVRGRPLPDVALIAGTYVGIFLVLGLMAFVLFQDVSRLLTMYF